MFANSFKNMQNLFEDFPLKLSEKEIVAIGSKSTPILKEGIKIIKNKHNGWIICTKNIKDDIISSFLIELIKTLQFPTSFSLDFAGFLTDSEEEQVFVFPSQNSSLDLYNDAKSVLLESKEQKIKLIQSFQTLTNADFLSRWYESHDRYGEFTKSGLKPQKLINLTVFLKPLHSSVIEMF